MIPYRYEEAIRIVMKYNRLHNDLDAYLYEICEWAIGEVPLKPKAEDFGINSQNGGASD